jgi:tetratricopeptide (TPR) repeat protein
MARRAERPKVKKQRAKSSRRATASSHKAKKRVAKTTIPTAPMIHPAPTQNGFQELVDRALAKERTADCAEAAELFRQAAEEHPGVSLPLVGLGRCLLRISKTREAIPVLQKALEVGIGTGNPRVCCEANFHLGYALDMEGEARQSYKHYQDALGYSRDAGDVIIEGAATQVMAGVFLRDGKFDLAKRYLQNAVEIYTEDAPSPEHLRECEQTLAELSKLEEELKPKSGLVTKILGAAAAAAAGIFLVWAIGATGGRKDG